MTTVATLNADLRAETSAFEVDLRRARSQLSSAEAKMNRSLGKLDGGFLKLSRSLKTFAGGLPPLRIGLAAVAGAGAIGLLLTNSLKAADAIGKVADKTGFATDALQELRFAADQSGVSQNTLDLSLQRFSRRLGEAAKGQGELLKTTQQYGVAVRNTDGTMRSNIDVFEDFANVIASAESEQEQLRIAFKLFDSEGAALVNLMRDGATGVQAYRDEARRFGLVLEEDLIRNAEKVNDQFNLLTSSLTTRFRAAVLQLTPAISALMQAFLDRLPPLVRGLEEVAYNLGLISDVSARTEISILTTQMQEAREELNGLNDELRFLQSPLGSGVPEVITRTKKDIYEAEQALGALQARLDKLNNDVRLDSESSALRVTIPGGQTDGGFAPGTGPRPGDRNDALQKLEEDQLRLIQRIDEEHRRTFESEFQRITRLEQEAIASLNQRLLSEEEYAEAVGKIRETATEQRSRENERVSEEARRALEEEMRATQELSRSIDSTLLRSVGDLASGYGDLRSVAVSALQDILQSVLRLNAAQAAGGSGGGGGILSGLFKLGSSFFGGSSLAGVGPTPGTLITPFAAGGDYPAGKARLVGEQGPEIDIPKTAGTIIPASVTKAIAGVGGKSGGDVYQIDARGADRQGLARLEAMIRELNGSIEKRSVAAVTDSRRRNPALFV
ncbi:MAG: hypothetical protein RIM72_11005 [Alphaproteobacteria bacterium]